MRALGSQCATVINDLPVIALCKELFGTFMGGTLAGFDRVERFWLDIATRVIALHEQRERRTEGGSVIGIGGQTLGRKTSEEQWTIVLPAEH